MVGPLLEVTMSKKCTPLWREAQFQVKMYKTHHGRTTFGSCYVEKVHAVVAQTNSKSKCRKHTILAPLLEVAMSKKCTPLWRKPIRSQNVESTPFSHHFWKFRSRKSARRCGGSTFGSQNVKNTRGSDHFWRFRCRKSARRCGAKHIWKS